MVIVILTGAGISQESGLKTFRDQDGLWENHRIEDVASIEGYRRNPQLVQNFYNERRKQLLEGGIEPNPAHRALAELEAGYPAGQVLLVTQNVDDLHERAGSRNLIHMHGELLKARCQSCSEVQACRSDLSDTSACASCQAQGRARPHIVWFGEIPFELDRIAQALSQCECFIAIGTSGQVYPAAGFVSEVPAGSTCIEVNLAPSAISQAFTERLYGKASALVPQLVQRILNGTTQPAIERVQTWKA